MKQLPHFPTSPLPHFPTSPHPTPCSLDYQNYESKNCLFRIRSDGSADDD
ncbi:MAG: hypothetical protein LW716_13010 [Microcystis sp. 53602_E8]|nr:hypothetical protein [Microcystis sp. M53602_WE12]MCE2663606.1 hypothetical protein [Microcystis sp. 53602_E8]MDJ0524274.1 hypothetical protein [Microcystis sp. M53600_WE12]MDJ0603368.1 hypothetical protein [Microcystis sp. M53602_WE12]